MLVLVTGWLVNKINPLAIINPIDNIAIFDTQFRGRFYNFYRTIFIGEITDGQCVRYN